MALHFQHHRPAGTREGSGPETTAATAGILPNRRAAQPALLRMLSRARRRQAPLLLVRVLAGPGEGAPAAAWTTAGSRAPLDPFPAALAADLRIGDLVWREPGGAILFLLEDAPAAAATVLRRLERRALGSGVQPRWQSARFPEQGLTLQSLLEAVQWE